ncbi:MAG TPA: ABC transporter permease [Terriglobia bacterium]|jgi:putative ABC transport system permease protein|nr:ABC transporter permease [Terriglobia bacterium]
MSWIKRLLGRRRLYTDLSQEIREHLSEKIEDLVAGGMSREEATHAARREFGNAALIEERGREVWQWLSMESFIADIRYALRMLRKNPAFTVVAILTLALGIGANTAIFSVVNAVLLRPLPYQDSDRLVVVLHYGVAPVSPGNFLDWQRQNHVFTAMGAAEYWTPNLTGIDEPERVWALHISSDILPLLGVQPLLGRMFLKEEEQKGRDHEVILSYGAWQKRFGGSAGVIGRPMTLDGERYVVVGVMPRDFKFAPFWATKAELWAPLALGDRAADRGGNSLRIFARLKPGITLDQARSEMSGINSRLEKEYPGTSRDYVVLPLKERVVGDIRPALLVLLGAVCFVLLIACANVAHMMLARSAVRQREVAVRTALGAGRGRIIRQLLTESLLLTLAGAGAGLLLALWGIHVLVALSPAGIPRVQTVSIDANVLVFMFVVSVLTGLGFGLVPALRSSAVSLNDSLKEGGRGSIEGARGQRLRGLLMASEFAMAVILLVGAGLMIRSFIALQSIDPGFDPDHVLTLVVSVTGSQSADATSKAAFYGQVLEQVRALPGVQSAGVINHLPLAGDLWDRTFAIEGRAAPRPGEAPDAIYRVVWPGYFHAMNIPILRGRDIARSDGMNSPGVVVVNDALARQFWPGQDAIGKRFALTGSLPNAPWLTVVGITKDVIEKDWAHPPDPEMYLPYLQLSEADQAFLHYLTLVVRTAGEPTSVLPEIRSQILRLNQDATISQVDTMPAVIREATAQPRFYLLLLGAFAAIALTLAAVGIYGVMSYSVSRRTHEIGIRMALGAKAPDVLKLVTRQGMLLALWGAMAGIVFALALARGMSSLLYGVHSDDPLTILGVVLVLAIVGLAATYIPARRATKVDPMVALRYE